MATDIATLGLKIETAQVEQGIKSLDRLQQAGDRAEKSAGNLERSSSRLNSAMGQTSSSSSHLAGEMMKVAAAVGLAYAAYNRLSDVISMGMKLETMNVVMNQVGKNVGISTAALHYFVEEVKSSGITTTESMSAITKAMQMGLNLNQMKEFATRVRDVAVGARDAQGNLLNTSQTLMRAMQGLSSGQIEILRTLGLQGFRGVDEVYKSYAATLGKTKDELNSAHKAQAMFNEFMRASTPLAGAAAAADETVGKQLASMARYSETAKEALWDLFKPGMEAGVLTLTNAFKALKTWADTNHTSLNALGLQVGAFVGQAGAAGIGAAQWAASNFELLRSIAELYVIVKVIAWIRGLYTAMVAAEGAAVLLKGSVAALNIAIGTANYTTYATSIMGAASSMRVMTEAGIALNAMMMTLLPNVVAASAALAVYGAYKNFTEPAGAGKPMPSGTLPEAWYSAGPTEKDVATEQAASIAGPPVPSESVLQMNRIMDRQKKWVEEGNKAHAAALAKALEGAGGKGGKGAEAAENSLARFIDTMISETARGAGDTETILNSWYAKQSTTLEQMAAKGIDVTRGKEALDTAYYSKLEKLNSEFNDWYISGLGNSYEALVSAERKKLTEVAGNAEKVAKVQEVFDRRHYDLSQQMETERLNLLKGSYDTMAGLSPVLADQLGYKQQALEIELQLADAALTRAFNEGKITQDTYDQLRALRAVEAQAKRGALTKETWTKGGGFGAGLTLYREDMNKQPAMFSGVWWKESMTGAENWIGSTFANTALDIFENRKTDFRAMGKQMLVGFFGEMMKSNFQQLLRGSGASGGGLWGWLSGAKGQGTGESSGASSGVSQWEGEFSDTLVVWEDVAKQNQAAGGILNQSGVQNLAAGASLAVGALGMITGSKELMAAAMVIQTVMMTIQAIETVSSFIPFFHLGAIIAHAGLAPDERLIIGQTGEGILPRDAMRQYAAMGVSFDMLKSAQLPVAVARANEVRVKDADRKAPAPAVNLAVTFAPNLNVAEKMTKSEIKQFYRENFQAFREVAKEKGIIIGNH